MKKILITGANGFIGSHLVEKALQSGFETYAGVRETSNLKYLNNPDIKIVNIDFTKPLLLKKLLYETRFNYIIHNAGTTIAASENEYKASNFGNLKILTDLIKDENITLEKFVYISSLAAFGPNELNDDKPISNNSVPHPITAYGRSKLMAEEYLKTQNIPFIIIRPTAVYGPRDTGFLPVYKMINNGFEVYSTRKDQKLSFIYIDDLVDAIFASLLGPANSCYFVSDGNKYSLHDFYHHCKEYLGKKTISIKVHSKLSYLLATLNEWGHLISKKFPPFNRDKVNELSALGWICDNSPIKNQTGFIPQYSLQQGLEKTIHYLKETGVL